jgi:hypothetical protein
LRVLEAENRKLKQLLADTILENNAINLISRMNYDEALPGSWMFKALRISRCALVISVRT